MNLKNKKIHGKIVSFFVDNSDSLELTFRENASSFKKVYAYINLDSPELLVAYDI